MNLKRPYGLGVIGPAVATAVAATLGASIGSGAVVAVAAAAFALLAVVAGWVLNDGFRRLPSERVSAETGPIASLLNARLLAVVYAWGGASMLGAYYLTSLFWHHAWQYGGAMLLIAAGLHLYASALANPTGPARSPRVLLAVERLTVVQGIAALAGALAVLVSGKLATGKPDWAANIIFIAGGLTIGVVSALAVTTRRKLARPKS